MLKQLSDIGIIPVIKIEDPEKAVPLAEALIKGGLPAAEVTFRTEKAEDAIKKISDAFPEMLVGAGTVLTIEQAKRAVDAGAKFLVAPGFNPKVVAWCQENGILMLPGITSPSEIEQALEMGLTTLKFFPAEQSGGLAKIKAMSAPYSAVSFMPTGGISLDNMNDYLSFKKIIACGGSFMVKEDLINNGEWDKITDLTRQAVTKMLGFEIGHIGINSENEEEAMKTAKSFSCLLGGLALKDGNSSVFAGSLVEVMKSKGRGACGHIAIKTNSVDRAYYHLSEMGFEFDEESAVFNPDGTKKFIYLKEEIGGFAVHFISK